MCPIVCLFYDILQQSGIRFAILQDRETDFSYGVQNIEHLQTPLSNMRNYGKYDTCYQDAANLVGVQCQDLTKNTITDNYITK